MSTAVLKHVNSASLNVYFRVFNDSGQVFDFSDNTFKAIGSATTPQVAATERTEMDGTGRSGYTASINLTNINPYPLAKRYTFAAYDNGTPAATDAAISDHTEFVVQAGEVGELPITCMLDGAFTSSAGTALRLLAWLERGGQRISLAAGSISIAVREHGAGSDLFTGTAASPTASGDFEVTVASPGFTDDRVYRAVVAITVNTVTFTTEHGMPVQSAA